MGPRALLTIALAVLVGVVTILTPIVALFVLGFLAGALVALAAVWHVLPSPVRPWVRGAVLERLGR